MFNLLCLGIFKDIIRIKYYAGILMDRTMDEKLTPPLIKKIDNPFCELKVLLSFSVQFIWNKV